MTFDFLQHPLNTQRVKPGYGKCRNLPLATFIGNHRFCRYIFQQIYSSALIDPFPPFGKRLAGIFKVNLFTDTR
jgi:hypothetical protein